MLEYIHQSRPIHKLDLDQTSSQQGMCHYRPLTLSCSCKATSPLTKEDQLTIFSFHTHYGRWTRFPEDITVKELLPIVRKSPLLICSIFLIAVRHTTQDLADQLAPKLFEESKRLITASLLEVPQTIEFFQAVLILSFWSTTVGQVPLSIDSWLLTGYAIQQALASPCFAEVMRSSSYQPTDNVVFDAWCLWNHLCVVHLQ